MPSLPTRPDLGQLRRRAKELLHAAQSNGADAMARLAAVSGRVTLETAQLALAREHGFPSWSKLKAEIARRKILDSADIPALRALLAEHPGMAVDEMRGWCDHPGGAAPLSYVAMLRYDTARGVWRDVAGTGEMARALLDAGAPVDGRPGDAETPLMTAASYGDAAVAQVLIDAGADINLTASPDAGGVAGGTALRHAAVFDMGAVVDVLLQAGAQDLVQAAAAGDITGMLSASTPEADRIAALRIAAEHRRVNVIDELLAAGTPVDGVDQDGSTALHEAAYSGQPDSVRHLLQHGADPTRRDTRFNSTPLGWCRHRREETGPSDSHDVVETRLQDKSSD